MIETEPRPGGGPRTPFPARGAAAVSVVSVLLFGETFLGGSAAFARDVFNYYWPMRQAWLDGLAAGGLPQWAAHSQSGLPLLGDLHAATLYPPNLLYAVLPFPTAYGVLLLFHHLALSVGMVVLLYRIFACSEVAATAGGVVLAASGYVAGLTNMGPILSGLAYLPWVLLLMMMPGRHLERGAGAGLLLAMQGLCGDPQSVVFSLLIALICVGWRGGFERSSWSRWAVAGAVAALVAAVQLVPSWYVLLESTRASLNPRFATEFSFHPARLAEWVLPFPFGQFAGPPSFWAWSTVQGPGSWPFALSAYVGAASAAVVLVGARLNRTSAAAITCVVLGVWLSLGESGGLGWVLTNVPPLRFFRYPEKYLLVATFGAALWVADAFDVATASVLRGGQRRVRWVVGGAVFVGAAVGVLALGPSARGTLPGSFAHAAFCAGVTVVGAWLCGRNPTARAPVRVAIVAALGLDLLTQASPLVQTAPEDLYELTPPLVEELRRQSPQQPFRFIRDHQLTDRSTIRSEDDLLRKRAWELATLRSNLGGPFGLEEVGGYTGGFSLHRWNEVALALYEDQARLGSVFNGCVLLTKEARHRFTGESAFEPVHVDSKFGYALFRNSLCTPRVHPVTRVLAVGSLSEALPLLRDTRIDLRTTAIAEGTTPRDYAPATVTNVRSSLGRTEAHVEAGATGTFVVFATSYFPGWRATVDGTEAPLRISNGATMGVEVSAGGHEVAFEFEHPGQWAWALTALGLLLAALCFVLGSGQGKDGEPVHPP